MAALTNPIGKQNIIDRFADFVVATANGSIVWAKDAKPFAEMPDTVYEGNKVGRTIVINAASITGTDINATTLRNVLEGETYNYTNIRKQQARLNVTGDGGNAGTRADPGIIFDQTAVAYQLTTRRQSIGTPDNAGVVKDTVISATKLETYFSNLRTAWATARDNTVVTTVDVCHASCHSSCHSARGRR